MRGKCSPVMAWGDLAKLSICFCTGITYIFATLVSFNAALDIPETKNINSSVGNKTARNKDDVPSLRSGLAFNQSFPSSRIINGFYVSETSFKIPWIVLILDGDRPICTGSLINKQYILTAAHCVVSKPKDYWGYESCWSQFQYTNRDLKAIIGESNYKDVIHNQSKVHRISKTWFHEKYEGQHCGSTPHNFDFAILKLVKPVSNTPVCLSSGVKKGMKWAYDFGFGATSPHKNQPMNNQLKGIKQHVVKRKECSKFYGYEIPSSQVCLRADNDFADLKEYNARFSGACKGDSGGPLAIYNHYNGFIQVALTSAGSGDDHYDCSGEYPNLFARVSKALPFIRSKAGYVRTC